MEPLSDAFRRQRRNVLLSSVFIAIYFASGARIEKINILGTYIVINNPSLTNILILLFHCYFILRYWQYYKKENTEVRRSKEKLHREMEKKKSKYLMKKILNKYYLNTCIDSFDLERKFNKIFDHGNEGHFYFKKNEMNYKEDVKISFFKNRTYLYLTAHLFKQVRPSTGKHDKELEDALDYIETPEEGLSMLESGEYDTRMFKSNNEAFVFLKDNNTYKFVGRSKTQWCAFVYETYIDYNILNLYVTKVQGAVIYLLNESSFTDYFLPFIVIIISACFAINGFMVT